MALNVLSTLNFSVEELLSNIHWTEANLAKMGIVITPEFVADALKSFWKHSADGNTGHAKKYVPFDEDLKNWTEGALVGFVHNNSGVKNIHFGRDNLALGMPVSHADMIVRDKATGVRRMTLECMAISDLRTGWFALTWADLVLRGKTDVEVVVIGAGPVATACIRLLNVGAADKIKSIKVLSKSGKTNYKLVEKLQPDVKIHLEATNDRAVLPKADYLILATNAGKPVVEDDEIRKNAKVLSQGIDDLPAEYIQRLINGNGLIVGDDMEAMETRNVDPLALFYSRQGKKLTVEGKADGVINYANILFNPAFMRALRNWEGDAAFFPVGLAGYDLAIGVKVCDILEAKLTAAV